MCICRFSFFGQCCSDVHMHLYIDNYIKKKREIHVYKYLYNTCKLPQPGYPCGFTESQLMTMIQIYCKPCQMVDFVSELPL